MWENNPPKPGLHSRPLYHCAIRWCFQAITFFFFFSSVCQLSLSRAHNSFQPLRSFASRPDSVQVVPIRSRSPSTLLCHVIRCPPLRFWPLLVGGQRPFIPVNLRGQHLEDVNNFIYLGSSINRAGNVDVELNRRTALASSAFSQLSKVWRNRNIRLPVKMRIYNACVLPVFSYGSETWQLTEKQEKKLDVFDQRCLRPILRVRWQQRVSNAEIRRRSQQEALSVKTRKARLRWFGHVSRMEGGRITKQAMEWRPRSHQLRPCHS